MSSQRAGQARRVGGGEREDELDLERVGVLELVDEEHRPPLGQRRRRTAASRHSRSRASTSRSWKWSRPARRRSSAHASVNADQLGRQAGEHLAAQARRAGRRTLRSPAASRAEHLGLVVLPHSRPGAVVAGAGQRHRVEHPQQLERVAGGRRLEAGVAAGSTLASMSSTSRCRRRRPRRARRGRATTASRASRTGRARRRAAASVTAIERSSSTGTSRSHRSLSARPPRRAGAGAGRGWRRPGAPR